MAMLALRHIEKSFGATPILKDVSLEVEKGDVVAIVGPSGSGKTTLLRIADFFETADKGTYDFEGLSFKLPDVPKKDISAIRSRTGFVFQNYNLFANFTALGNVAAGLRYGRKIPKEQAEAKAEACLAKVGLSDRLHHYPSALSGGQQQRVGIARAIAADPDVIFLDEPTSALDPELIGEVLSVIRQLAEEGRTMVIVTHELRFARRVATKLVFMENGVVVEEGKPEDLFTKPKNPRTKEFLTGHDEHD